jgi:hypothetical protein
MTKKQFIENYHYPKIIDLRRQRLYISRIRTIDRKGKMEFLIIVSFKKREKAMEYYKQRWQMEPFLEV